MQVPIEALILSSVGFALLGCSVGYRLGWRAYRKMMQREYDRVRKSFDDGND